jgi:hypothetical protein
MQGIFVLILSFLSIEIIDALLRGSPLETGNEAGALPFQETPTLLHVAAMKIAQLSLQEDTNGSRSIYLFTLPPSFPARIGCGSGDDRFR